MTFDPGFTSTASCVSAITYIVKLTKNFNCFIYQSKIN